MSVFFSIFLSLSLSVFFLRVFEKVFLFFFPFARLKLLSETFNSEKNLLVNFAARLGFEGLSRGEDKIQIIFLRRLWIEMFFRTHSLMERILFWCFCKEELEEEANQIRISFKIIF